MLVMLWCWIRKKISFLMRIIFIMMFLMMRLVFVLVLLVVVFLMGLMVR